MNDKTDSKQSSSIECNECRCNDCVYKNCKNVMCSIHNRTDKNFIQAAFPIIKCNDYISNKWNFIRIKIHKIYNFFKDIFKTHE